MLRRPPTVLSITAEDIAAYEDRQERAAFRAATQQGFPQHQHLQHQHHQHPQQQQYADAGGFSSSDNDDFVSDDEAMLDAFDGQHQQHQHQQHQQAQAQAQVAAMRGAIQQVQQVQGMQTPTPAGQQQGYDAGAQGRGGGGNVINNNGLPEPQAPQAPQRQRAGRGAPGMPQQQGQGQGGAMMGPGQGAAVTPEGRVTRSRDERIGIARGAGRR